MSVLLLAIGLVLLLSGWMWLLSETTWLAKCFNLPEKYLDKILNIIGVEQYFKFIKHDIIRNISTLFIGILSILVGISLLINNETVMVTQFGIPAILIRFLVQLCCCSYLIFQYLL